VAIFDAPNGRLSLCRIAGRRAGVASAALVALLAAAVSASAATVPFRIDPDLGSPFSGRGFVAFDGTVSGPGDIDALSVRVASQGTVSYDDGMGGFLPAQPVTHVFAFGPGDVAAVSGLALTAGGGLAGSISFSAAVSENDLITLDGFSLDFDTGRASGFCFYNDVLSECVAGGGSSSGVDGRIVAPAPIPAPAALPLLAVVLGGFFGLGRFRQRADTGRSAADASSLPSSAH
jgi:hypothetical protein